MPFPRPEPEHEPKATLRDNVITALAVLGIGATIVLGMLSLRIVIGWFGGGVG